MEAIRDFICIYIVNNEVIYGPLIVFVSYQLLKYFLFHLRLDTIIFLGFEFNILSINVFLAISRDLNSMFSQKYGQKTHSDVWVILCLIILSLIQGLLIQLKKSTLDVKLLKKIQFIVGEIFGTVNRRKTRKKREIRRRIGKAVNIFVLIILYVIQVFYVTFIIGSGLAAFIIIASFK